MMPRLTSFFVFAFRSGAIPSLNLRGDHSPARFPNCDPFNGGLGLNSYESRTFF